MRIFKWQAIEVSAKEWYNSSANTMEAKAFCGRNEMENCQDTFLMRTLVFAERKPLYRKFGKILRFAEYGAEKPFAIENRKGSGF